jgi:hypothetical protein
MSLMLKEVLLSLQIEVYVEMLHCAIRDKNREKIHEMLSLLSDNECDQFFKLLWEECGKPVPFKSKEYFFLWAKYAFHDICGYSPSLQQQINAVIKLRQIVRSNISKVFDFSAPHL